MKHQVLADNNNKEINVILGDSIEIQLDETPTSGYNWDVESLDGEVCQLQSSDYKMYDGAGIGGGGIRTMSFLVINKGYGSIKLKNWQRWSGDVYQEFTINVNAQ